MEKRLELHSLLKTMGAEEVYFQPPSNSKMVFPAIVYQKDDVWTVYAANLPYTNKKRYQVTVIDRNPDSPIPDEVGKLSLCSFSRNFVADNLLHNVFNLYY